MDPLVDSPQLLAMVVTQSMKTGGLNPITTINPISKRIEMSSLY
jgi:hypothetical protein